MMESKSARRALLIAKNSGGRTGYNDGGQDKINDLKQKIEEIQKNSKALRAKYEQSYADHMAKRPNGFNKNSWSSAFHEQGKQNFPDYFSAQQNINNLKNEISKIEKKHKAQERKNAIAPLEQAMSEKSDLINNAHKIQNISFRNLPISVFDSAGQYNEKNPAFLLHKSTNYNKRQSSEYKLMIIDGKPAYARKSNHWGTFGTNIKDVDDAVSHLKISREEAENRQMNDPFGRIGTRYHNWSLTGGDENKNTSQAGYIHLDDLDQSHNGDVIDRALRVARAAGGRNGYNDGGSPDGAAENAVSIARKLSPIGLYSKAAEQAAQLKQTAPAAQLIGQMVNKGGIKKDELFNAGITDSNGNINPEWAAKGKMTPADLAEHFQGAVPQVEETQLGGRGSNMPTKYEGYTLPGGENYREVLLKFPNEKLPNEVAAKDYYKNWVRKGGDPLWENLSADEKNNIIANLPEHTKYGPEKFRSPHWDDPNVLAHIRMSDRTGPDGEKILHVEELQSDWGQHGRERGFVNPELKDDFQKLVKKRDAIDDANYKVYNEQSDFENSSTLDKNSDEYQQTLEKLRKKQRDLYDQWEELDKQVYNHPYQTYDESKEVPLGPYVTSTEGWTDLALKRVFKEAAEGGYHKIVWTPGAEQARRYDLSKQISNLEYLPEQKMLRAFDNNGNSTLSGTVKPHEIADYVGKDVADKLLNNPTKIYESGSGKKVHSVSGLDLKVGGEGMKGYYDDILPKRLRSLAQKHDKKATFGYHSVPNIGDLPGLDITPQMRESILKGQEAFKRGGSIPRNKKSSPIIEHALGKARVAPIDVNALIHRLRGRAQ